MKIWEIYDRHFRLRAYVRWKPCSMIDLSSLYFSWTILWSTIISKVRLGSSNNWRTTLRLFVSIKFPAFGKGHSTTSSLLGVRDDMIRSMRRGEISVLVFADCSKTFLYCSLQGYWKRYIIEVSVKRVLMCRLMTADQTKKTLCLACRKALYSMGPLIISGTPRNEPVRKGYPNII